MQPKTFARITLSRTLRGLFYYLIVVITPDVRFHLFASRSIDLSTKHIGRDFISRQYLALVAELVCINVRHSPCEMQIFSYSPLSSAQHLSRRVDVHFSDIWVFDSRELKCLALAMIAVLWDSNFYIRLSRPRVIKLFTNFSDISAYILLRTLLYLLDCSQIILPFRWH